MKKQFKVCGDGFVWRLLPDAMTAKRFFLVDSGIELYVLHDDDSETAIKSWSDFERFPDAQYGIEVGFIKEFQIELQTLGAE